MQITSAATSVRPQDPTPPQPAHADTHPAVMHVPGNIRHGIPVASGMDVDIWSDIACPWCYIGKRRFEKALADFAHRDEVEVTWHSFQLDPSLPEHYDGTEADYLSERKGMPIEGVRQMFDQVAEQAAGEGLAYDFDRLVVANSMRGHQLLHLAREHDVADQVKEALLSAHFEHGVDIGDVDELTRIGVAAGLDADEIRATVSSDRYRDGIQADIEQAREIGVSGVPFFVLGGRYGVSGAQPPATLLAALEKAWADTQSIVMADTAQGEACGPDGCAI